MCGRSNYDWQNNWHLQHKRENRRVSCASYQHMIAEYFRQWRDPDGSIPWTMEREPRDGA